MKRFLIGAAALAMLVGCAPKKDEDSGTQEQSIAVSVVEVKKEKVSATLEYSGTVEAIQTIPLTFNSTGTVEKVFVNAGDAVKKGQVLATVDQTDAENMYQISLAKYNQAKDAYDRLKTVYDKGSLTEIKWVEMETNLEQAKSSLEIAKNNLDKCKLYAPVNGIIGSRDIEPGMSALSLANAPLEIVDIRQVYIKISVPENEFSKISKGMNAIISVAALDNKQVEGEVSIISPVADKLSRTYEVKIKVENASLSLKPGMVCNVKMDITVQNEIVLVPYQSVSKDSEENTFVFVVDPAKKRVKKQLVKTGKFVGSSLEVLSGLTQGQLIVNEGKEKLSDNSLISL